LKTPASFRRVFGIAILALLATACDKNTDPNDPDDPNNPQNPDALGLAVSVRVDPNTFRTTGEFDLELLPTTKEGVSLVNEQWTITNALTAPSGASASLLSQGVPTSDPRPISLALVVDNSSSMSTNDPDRERASAAQTLFQSLVQANPANRGALLHFGLGIIQPTPGFTRTRILRNWTSNAAELVGHLDTLSIGTGSPLYAATLEVAKWMDTTAGAATGTRRVLVLMSDGLGNDPGGREALLAAATAANVQIYTVGLGAGSDRSTRTDPTAVTAMQTLANGTGGLYAGAATAERLGSVLQSFVVSGGRLVARFKLATVPAASTSISGTVKLENNRGIAQAPWTFVAP